MNETTGQTDCVRRGSARSYRPLSDFAPQDNGEPLDPTYVAEHMLPLFEYAAEVIPPSYHPDTAVTYQATAGMRLLTEDQQEDVYDALYEGLLQSETFVFSRLARSDLATLSGEMEGFFGAVAANYLKGIVDSKLRANGNDHMMDYDMYNDDDGNNDNEQDSVSGRVPLGAMDMGGSSTQIVYMPAPESTDNNDSQGFPSRLHEDHFFSVSHLAYGVDRFRERLWDTWIDERDATCTDHSCNDDPIRNPCANPGYELLRRNHKLVGTGDTDECVRQIQRLLPTYGVVAPTTTTETDSNTKETTFPPRKVAGVEHPPLQGKFVAMSLFFFSLDSLRVLSAPAQTAHEALNKAWPTPSIQELHDALDGLCSRSWHDDLVHIQHNSHAYTRAEVLPHRCFESAYLATLLRDGYGFAPESRDVTFTFLVDGSEVEWSLGMALTQHADEYEAAAQRKTDTSNNKTFEHECEPTSTTTTTTTSTSENHSQHAPQQVLLVT